MHWMRKPHGLIKHYWLIHWVLLMVFWGSAATAETDVIATTQEEVLATAQGVVVPTPDEALKTILNVFLENLREHAILIPPSKYEPRRTIHAPIFVIHETASSGAGTMRVVTQPAYRASFHALILRDGTIVYMVPSNKAAYTAGYSQFQGQYDIAMTGRRTVNYFAYQVELESPVDGYWCKPNPTRWICEDGGGRGPIHSGYTDAQYMALAWLAKRTEIPPARITTHAQVDLSMTRTDPRSFDWDKFWRYYHAMPPIPTELAITLIPKPLAQLPEKPVE